MSWAPAGPVALGSEAAPSGRRGGLPSACRAPGPIHPLRWGAGHWPQPRLHGPLPRDLRVNTVPQENWKAVFMVMPPFPWTRANCTAKINGAPSRPVLKDAPLADCALSRGIHQRRARGPHHVGIIGARARLQDGISAAHQRCTSPLLKAS